MEKIVKVALGRVLDRLALPIGECIRKTRAELDYSSVTPLRFAYISLTPPWMIGSAVPSWNLFQLSAVPIKMLGNVDCISCIFDNSCCAVKLFLYRASEPTVIA